MTKELRELHTNAIRDTARVVRIMNPSAANYPEDALVKNMEKTAREVFEEFGSSYGSTLGFVVTTFTTKEGANYVLPSVTTYNAQQYAKRMQAIEQLQKDALSDIVDMARSAANLGATGIGYWTDIIEKAEDALRKAEKL